MQSQPSKKLVPKRIEKNIDQAGMNAYIFFKKRLETIEFSGAKEILLKLSQETPKGYFTNTMQVSMQTIFFKTRLENI